VRFRSQVCGDDLAGEFSFGGKHLRQEDSVSR
jgi:hypothetical protein